MLPTRFPRIALMLVTTLLAGGLVLARWERPAGSASVEAPGVNGAQDVRSQAEGARLRVEKKEGVARMVLNGQMTLVRAAREFRSLDRGWPPFNQEQFRYAYPGATEDERHCREVIAWVRIQEDDDPCLGPAVVARLERQLQVLLDKGPIHLPEAPPPEVRVGPFTNRNEGAPGAFSRAREVGEP
jgi:hypothetical protein